jgi:hypothetical protein
MRITRVIVSLFAVVVFSVAVLSSQNNGAMLYAHGNVTLNGQTLKSSTSIFAGDRVDTADSSVVTINRKGSSVVVNPNSSVQYTQSSIEIMRGTARVSTLSGMSAQAGQLTITPKDGKAKFDVIQSGEGTVVTLREGSLIVRDGSETINLQPGATRMFASGAPSNQSVERQGGNGILPRDQVHTFDTAMNPDVPVCPNLQYCLGRNNVSQTNPCRCR